MPRASRLAAAIPALSALVALLLAGCIEQPKRPPRDRPNVLIVTIDTLRADALGCYGSSTASTPVLDGLAARGVRYETAWSVTPLTTPSHATLFTGTYPGTHGVRNNGRKAMAADAETLAEVLQEAGYRTGAAVGAYVVSRRFGLAQGFQAFYDDLGPGLDGGIAYSRRAEAVNAEARPWLEKATKGAEPWFLWVHYFDPHDPYDPPEPWATRHADRPYDGEVSYTDAAVGELLRTLDEAGERENTVIVVAGDHGESLGEHGEWTHGLLLYEAATRVPLIISAPGRLPEGETKRDAASLADVMPTVLGLLGLDAPGGVQGLDLLDEAPESGAGPLRPLYAETFYGQEGFDWAPLRALRVGDEKVILGSETERYDLAADPGEKRDLSAADAAATEALVRRLREVAEGVESAEALSSSEGDLPSAEDMAGMAGLGYVAGGGGVVGDPWDLTGRSPRKAIDDYEAFQGLVDLMRDGQAEKARELLEPLLERDPGNPQFRLKMAEALILTGDRPAAEKELLSLIDDRPTFAFAYARLSDLYDSENRLEESEKILRRLSEATGHSVASAELQWARALIGLGRFDEARPILESHLEQSPDEPRGLSLLARLEAHSGNKQKALDLYRRTLEIRQHDRVALEGAAELLLQAGRYQAALTLLDRAQRLAPGRANIHSGRSFALFQVGRPDEALAEAREAVRLEPENLIFRQHLGTFLLQMGRHDEAERTFDEILRARPGFVPTMIFRAYTRLEKGDRAGAEAAFREVLAIDPDNEEALGQLRQLSEGR